MRTTVDLDPELHDEAVAIARATRTSLSSVLNDVLRRAFHPAPTVEQDPVTGLGRITLGRAVTAAEVAVALNDD